jgi:transcriptional regulator with XRE-family HTH domain
MALAENIKEKRLEKNMSQEHLAGIVGVTRMAICNYEEGKRLLALYDALRIAKALGTTVEELALAENNKTAPKQ